MVRRSKFPTRKPLQVESSTPGVPRVARVEANKQGASVEQLPGPTISAPIHRSFRFGFECRLVRLFSCFVRCCFPSLVRASVTRASGVAYQQTPEDEPAMARQSIRRLAFGACVSFNTRTGQVSVSIAPAQRAEFPQSHSSACPAIRGTTLARR